MLVGDGGNKDANIYMRVFITICFVLKFYNGDDIIGENGLIIYLEGNKEQGYYI